MSNLSCLYVSILCTLLRMGSYLSVENDTDSTYMIKLGPGGVAIEISGIVLGVVAGIGAFVTSGGLGAMATAGALVDRVLVAGETVISAGAFTAITGIAGVGEIAADVAKKSVAAGLYLENELRDKGFKHLKPGCTKTYGRMALSLWQQCQCIRFRVAGDTLHIEEVFMRPIFSGATDGSTSNYTISYWVDKNSHTVLHSINVKDIKA